MTEGEETLKEQFKEEMEEQVMIAEQAQTEARQKDTKLKSLSKEVQSLRQELESLRTDNKVLGSQVHLLKASE